MNLRDRLARRAPLSALFSLLVGCGGAGASSGPACGEAAPPSYVSCVGSYIDGSCPAGGCGFGELATTAYAAWRARALEISGLSEEVFDQRVAITTVEVEPGPRVRIAYVIVIDWIRSRQAIIMDFSAASDPATDAEIASAADMAINTVAWARVGSVTSVAPVAEVQSALGACECGLVLDWCGIDFEPTTGALAAKGFEMAGASSSGACREARVDVVTAELLACDDATCTTQ